MAIFDMSARRKQYESNLVFDPKNANYNKKQVADMEFELGKEDQVNQRANFRSLLGTMGEGGSLLSDQSIDSQVKNMLNSAHAADLPDQAPLEHVAKEMKKRRDQLAQSAINPGKKQTILTNKAV